LTSGGVQSFSFVKPRTKLKLCTPIKSFQKNREKEFTVKKIFSDGFSLIELAIVLIIIGYLMGYLLIPISAKKDQQHLKSTQKTLEEIKEALLGFAVKPIYDDDYAASPIVGPPRIPCPARYGEYAPGHPEEEVGREDITLCGQEGFLPWKDLKVGRYDVWGNPFRYRAAIAFSTTGRNVGIDNISNNIGSLNVVNRQGNITWTVGNSHVAAIIFSDGKNNKADDDNADKDQTFVHDGSVYMPNLPIDDPNNFDDILTWLSRNTLMNRLTTAKRWPPDP
jgi:prepilin-type N-terminal cleavage/methylation domain-containing protein